MSKSTNLSEAVKHSIEIYFKDLQGERAHGIYSMVIESVEKTLIEEILSATREIRVRPQKCLGLTATRSEQK